MGPIQSIDDLINFLRRRWLLMMAVAAIGSVIAVIYAQNQPDSYAATAVLQIETPTVRDERAVADTSAAQRLQLIEQRMMVRDSLLAVIDRNRLFADLVTLTVTEKVDLLRRSTRIESVAGATGGAYSASPGISALIITVKLGDPAQAAAVANDFAQSVLDRSAAAQVARTRETVAFFTADEQQVGRELAALESEITAFKNANLDALPSRIDIRRDELLRIRQSVDQIDRDLAALETERTALEVAQPVREVSRRRIEAIATQTEVLDRQRRLLDDQRRVLDESMARAPAVETRLGAFDRRLLQLQDRYAVVTRRLAEAETDQRLETNEQAERFSLLEPAIIPDYAEGSGGRKKAAAGGVASLGLGVILAFLLDLMNPVLRSSAQMERQTGLRPIVAVPQVTRRQLRRVTRG